MRFIIRLVNGSVQGRKSMDLPPAIDLLQCDPL